MDLKVASKMQGDEMSAILSDIEKSFPPPRAQLATNLDRLLDGMEQPANYKSPSKLDRILDDIAPSLQAKPSSQMAGILEEVEKSLPIDSLGGRTASQGFPSAVTPSKAKSFGAW